MAMMAQNPAGNAFRIDYDQFINTNALKYFNCGNDNMLNVSDELTIEVWIQMRDLGDNQKLIGKFDLQNTSYLLGVDQGKIYPEVWTPTHVEDIAGLMNPLAQHWQHLCMTFKAGDAMKSYINGVEVGSVSVGSASIAPNTNDLIIGIASWDLANFQAFGNFDEVRIWNVSRTVEEINADMHRELTGTETGLVAYYDFNQSSGSMLPDVTGNGNTGTGFNVDDNEWVPSRAVIANDATEGAMDLAGLWNGIAFQDPRVAVTDEGMTISASGLDTADYAVFGHDGGSGVSIDDIAGNAPANFVRAARVWDMTQVGSINATVIMNIQNAAGGGSEIDGMSPVANYTLLYRATDSGDFGPVTSASALTNGVLTFNNVELMNGQYAIGVGDTEYTSIGIYEMDIQNAIDVYPNPSNGIFNLSMENGLLQDAEVEVLNLTGQVVLTVTDKSNGNSARLDISGQEKGVYLLRVRAIGQSFSQRLILK